MNKQLKQALRQRRGIECFPIINRGTIWYNILTNEQYIELLNWYKDWLDVTKTLVAPDKPEWLDRKIVFEEDIL